MATDKAITYLKNKAPKGEFLAYINKKEAAMLKKAGGSGELVNGIPSFRPQDSGNDANQKSSASRTSSSSKSSSKGTGGSKGNLGGGGGGQNTTYRSYKAPTKKTYTAKTIDSKPVTGNDYRDSKQQFIDKVNKDNRIAAAQNNTRFTPYQGGSRMQRSPGGLGNLLKLAIGGAFPGAGLLMGGLNKFGKMGKGIGEGITSLNDKIQNSAFGRSTSLMDYFNSKKAAKNASMNAGIDQGITSANADAESEMLGLQTQIMPKAKPTFSDPFRNTVGTTTQVNAPGNTSSYSYGAANAADVNPFVQKQLDTANYINNYPAPQFGYNPRTGEELVYGKDGNKGYIDNVRFDDSYYGAANAADVNEIPPTSYLDEFLNKPRNPKASGDIFSRLYNPEQIADLEAKYGNEYGITNTSTGKSSDARHMAAMNNLSNSLSPGIVPDFIGDTGAFLAGLINEVPALGRGLNKQNLGEIGEDIAANFRGSFLTPNKTTAEQIYGDVFEGSVPARTASVPTYGTAAAGEMSPTTTEDITVDGGLLNNGSFMESQISPRVIAAENAYYNQGKMPPEFLGDRLRMNMELGNARGFMGPGFAQGGLASMFTRRR
mgnify:FL=1